MGTTAPPLSQPHLRGRTPHLAQLGAELGEVAGSRRAKVLLIEAAPGAGKSRLLREAGLLAGRAGFAVLGPGTGDGPRPPAGSAARALGEAVRARVVEDPATPPRPLLVLVDDLHLADGAALIELGDLAARLGDRPVLWLSAFTTDRDREHDRDRSGGREPVRAFLGTLRGRLPVEFLRDLGPLPEEALAELVADCAGARPTPELLALADGVNTTPRAVIDLTRGLVADGEVRIADGLARLRPDPPPDTGGRSGSGLRVPARVPHRFSAMVRRDLDSLSEPTLKALRLAAVLGSPFAPEDLSALLGEAPVGLLSAVDEAVRRGLLVCGDHELDFRSEPVWRVLLDTVPAPVRTLLRRQAAELYRARPDGLERAALQLAQIARPGDTQALEVIAEAAGRLLLTDPPTAAALAARGMELLEPGRAERIRLARTAVAALTRAGDLDRAVVLARDTLAETPAEPGDLADPDTTDTTDTGPVDTAALRAALSTALLLRGDSRPAQRAAREALAHAPGEVRDRDAVVTHLAASYLNGDRGAGDRVRGILGAVGREAHAVRAGALAFHAFGQWRAGRVGDSVATLREAVALGRAGTAGHLVDPRWFLALALTRTEEFEEAAHVIDGCARSAGPGTRSVAGAVPGVLRAGLLLARGRPAEAEEAARGALDADGPRVPMLAPQVWLVLAHAALRRGAPAEAGEHLRVLERDFPGHAASPWAASRLLLDAQVAQAQGRAREVAEALRETVGSPEVLRELLVEDPTAAGWCVRSALAAELPGPARTVVEAAERLAEANRGVASVGAAAGHARALLDRDPEALARAARGYRGPWARAVADEDLAELLAAGGGAGAEGAIAALDRAMAAYAALGAERDEARVRARLRGLGVRRRHWTRTERAATGWESLTKTERRVAELVAAGLTNKQAARHLFVSPHTVGFHLRQIYRKLGIGSRTALVRIAAG
ncbi:LuxR C-terminal-related transcriptional regulator (plasmid) [Streptomyces sp. BI20]|uniref:helix-turn-helix transcriptional regulator n=1 Tax=Streptomyces sp. BI20 TaxID=3403460 RepID=UPI003C78C77D